MPNLTTSTDLVLQLHGLYEECPNLIGLFDAGDMLQYGNPAFRRTLYLEPDEKILWVDLLRRGYEAGVGTVIQTADFEAWLASARSRRGKLPFRAFEASTYDGRWIWMTETLRADGWMLCIGSDITELKASARSVRQARDLAMRAAQTDVLTGISNRMHIMEQLQLRLQQVHALQQPCGLVLLDLDYFKRVNDSYGHHAGDTVLRHFASTVNETLRRDDGFGRLGGEEFMLLFPNINADELERIVSRILDLVRGSRPLPEHPQFDYTCSAGVSMLEPHEPANSAYCRTDEALFVAKTSGRDRCIWASPSVP